MKTKKHPVVLIILDGWGYRKDPEFNAIVQANTPTWDHLLKKYPNMLIRASEAAVGLPSGQMGNSEVGHLNLGAGRVVYQEFSRVSQAIKTGGFFSNRVLTDAVDRACHHHKAVHIMGLLSPGGVHSHEDHIIAMVKLAAQRGAKKIFVHAFLDGRDTSPKSAISSIEKMQHCFDDLGVGQFASIVGRYFAMDRDHRWPRIKRAYDVIAEGEAPFQAVNALTALNSAYERNETDEFVQATSILAENTQQPIAMEDDDVLIFMNFRSDRARQITRPFIQPDFNEFDRGRVPKIGSFVSLTEYSEAFPIPVAFPPDRLPNVFGAVIAQQGLRQLRIAETEKYAHVTFFFNGGEEQPFDGEDRILIPSPDVATYDLKPEMSASELTDKLVYMIDQKMYDVIICNFANPDMVGHTGNMQATIKAIECLDACLARTVTAIEKVGAEAIITADHGNAEFMRDNSTQQAHTAHTTNLVPLIYVGHRGKLYEKGALADVAPTMLALMGLDKPSEMGGQSLINRDG